jgi:hypothetical protein
VGEIFVAGVVFLCECGCVCAVCVRAAGERVLLCDLYDDVLV